jgi:hypothetical protein
MRKGQSKIISVLTLLFFSFVSASAVEVASDFSMVGTWKTEHESKKITIDLKDDYEGMLSVEGLEPVEILKWDVETAKGGKVYLGLYFYSRDDSSFAKRTLKMYNQGEGFKLKGLYQSNNHIKVYNGLSVKDGKIEHNDGRMELKR